VSHYTAAELERIEAWITALFETEAARRAAEDPDFRALLEEFTDNEGKGAEDGR
jgi:hypothetical protein